MLSSIVIVVISLLLLWVAFKVVTFVASGCLKLVVFGVLATIIGAMIWYQMNAN
ncbi:MAG: hypothetical protein HY820_42970 [Acidobacteria bacterium]|nr:hypothetical protein [Acidobacteriota bacterium]